MDEHGPQLSWQWTADLRGFLKMSSSSTSSWWASSMGGKDLSDIMIPSFLMDFRDLLSPSEWTLEPTFMWTDLRDLISPKSWTLFLVEAWSWTGEDLFRCLKIHWSKIGICSEYFVSGTLCQGRNLRPLISLQTLHPHSLLENTDTCPDCPCCCCPNI